MSLLSSIIGKLLEKKQVEEDKFISEKARERDSFLKQFPHFINSASQIVIFPHVNPDGDCLGGAFGMREVLKDNFKNKKVYVVGSSQGVFPWLEMNFDDISLDIDYSSSLAIIVDSGGSDRVQRYQDFFGSPETQKWGAVIRIDHHEVKQDYRTDLSWVDGSYVACCEQLVQICDYYRWNMSSKAATYFYLGLLTDSGSFSNAEVSPRTFVIAAKALRAGANREFLISHLRSTHPLEARFKGYILENFVQEEKMAWFFAKNEAVEKFKPYSITSNQVSALANIEGNVLWMLFLEVSPNEIRVSFRSVGTLDVRVIAEEFGGGGHLNASGTTITNADQVQFIVKRARQLVKDFIDQKGETSKDVLAEKARDTFDDVVNPAFRFELTPEEEQSLLAQKNLLKETHDSLASQVKIREAEEIVNSDAAFDTFLVPPKTFSDIEKEKLFDPERENHTFRINRDFDDSQVNPKASSDSVRTLDDDREFHFSKAQQTFDDSAEHSRTFDNTEKFFDPTRDIHSSKAHRAFDDSQEHPRVSSEPVRSFDDRELDFSRTNPVFDDSQKPPRVSSQPDREFNISRSRQAFDDSIEKSRTFDNTEKFFDPTRDTHSARVNPAFDDSKEHPRVSSEPPRPFDDDREFHFSSSRRAFDDSLEPPKPFSSSEQQFDSEREFQRARTNKLFDDSEDQNNN